MDNINSQRRLLLTKITKLRASHEDVGKLQAIHLEQFDRVAQTLNLPQVFVDKHIDRMIKGVDMLLALEEEFRKAGKTAKKQRAT